jgi:hypothetical protein
LIAGPLKPEIVLPSISVSSVVPFVAFPSRVMPMAPSVFVFPVIVFPMMRVPAIRGALYRSASSIAYWFWSKLLSSIMTPRTVAFESSAHTPTASLSPA